MSLRDGARLLRTHLAPQRRVLLHLLAWSAVEAVPAFASGLAVARAIDRGFLEGRPVAGFLWLGALACLWVIGAVGTRQVYPWLSATVEPLRDSLSTAVVSASLRRALDAGGVASGASVAQATAQVEAVRALLSTLLRNLRGLVSSGVAALGGLTVLSPRIALLVAPFLLLALAVFAGMLRLLVTRNRAVVLTEEAVSTRAMPVVEGVRDVVALGAESRAREEVGQPIESHAAALRAFARARVWGPLVVLLGVYLPLLALMAASPWLVQWYALTVGQIVGSVYYLFNNLRPALQTLVNAGGAVLVNLGVVLARLAEVCTEAPMPAVGSPGVRPERSGIEVEDVTFAYSPTAEPVVRDLSMRIPEGLHLAVVGPSGVGKSTLANLLARLVSPQRGELRLGGIPLEHVEEDHLRNTVALIPQEAYVFAGTVRENLSYLHPGASKTGIEAAAAAVGLDDTVARLGGMDAEIPAGGGTLSPGERQLIALARVYLSQADVVVLDEATCHLDPVAEARAEQAFSRRHGTLVVIAHRISSVRRADRILVMDGAEPVLGTHEELLRASTLYAQLVGYWNVTSPARTPESGSRNDEAAPAGRDEVANPGCGVPAPSAGVPGHGRVRQSGS